jgi:hypothetical protein
MRNLGQLLAGQVTLRPSAAPARVLTFAVSTWWCVAPGVGGLVVCSWG